MDHTTPTRRLRLRPNVESIDRKDHLLLIGDGAFQIDAPSADVRAAVQELCRPTGSSVQRLETLLGPALAQEAIAALERCDLLQSATTVFPATLPVEGAARYFDATLPSPDAYRPLSNQRVLIVGCGAVGGEVARHLLASGLGHLVLVDQDTVEEGNLNRQYLYRTSDIGRDKLVAAREALAGLSPTAQIDLHHRYVATASDLHDLDLPRLDAVVCCADTPPQLIGCVVSEYARQRGALFAIGSVGLLSGSVGPIVRADATHSYHDVMRPHVADDLAEELSPKIPSFGPTNSLISAMLAHDLLHVLAGGDAPSLDHRVTVDFRTHTSIRMPLVPQDASPRP